MQALAMPASRYIFGTLPWYSVTMVPIVVAILLALREGKAPWLPKGHRHRPGPGLIPWHRGCPALYYVAFTWDLFRSRPLAILEIWKGGLAIYESAHCRCPGGPCVLPAAQAVPFTLVDMVVPGLALAQCHLAVGDYFNMEAYGLPITNPPGSFSPRVC